MKNYWLDKNPKAKFIGKFQEACQMNWSYYRSSLVWSFLFGWTQCQHCDCKVCERDRDIEALDRCTKENRCEACVRKSKNEYKDKF